MNRSANERYWSFPAYVFRELTAFMLLCWAGFVIAVMGIVFSIDRWGSLNESVWEDAVQAPLWFVLFMGVQVAMVYLPMNITHGKTRRDSTIEAGLFVIAFSAVAALLITIGWGIERAVFSLLDVEQVITGDHLFSTPTEYARIFAESWINLAIWTAGGLFIAAAYYRFGGEGLLAIIPACLVSAIADLFLGSSWGPIGNIVDNLFDPRNPPFLLAIAVGVAAVAAMLYMAWMVIRELPIRKLSS